MVTHLIKQHSLAVCDHQSLKTSTGAAKSNDFQGEPAAEKQLDMMPDAPSQKDPLTPDSSLQKDPLTPEEP